MKLENNFQSKEESKNNDSNIPSENNGLSYFKLFCQDCLQIPKYKIKIDKNKTIFLSHTCNKLKKTKQFNSEEKISFRSNGKCVCCKKQCNSICIDCNQYICHECGKSHIPEENVEIPQISILMEKEKEKSRQHIWQFYDIQCVCTTHFIQYEFCCFFCGENLCCYCKNYHTHINCCPLYEYSIKNEELICSKSDELVKNLKDLSKIFKECYLYSLKNKKMTFNILSNYLLIKEIKNFLVEYSKDKIKDDEISISNKPIKKEDIDHYICKYFYDKKFRKNYEALISSVNNGNYESYVKMETIKQFYKNLNRYNENYEWDETNFYNSLKLSIETFKMQYYRIHQIVSSLNKEIYSNYSKKRFDDMNLILKVYDTDIKLLKKINLNLLYKFDYQLRRKIGNLIGELIITNYSNLLDPIKETNYIINESLEQIRKNISQIKNIKGEEKKINNYKNELYQIYHSLLEKSTKKTDQEKENIEKQSDDKIMNLLEENEPLITFHQMDDTKNNVNEAILLNLFFKLRKSFGGIFNPSIHNKTELVNAQIKEDIEKIKNSDNKDNEIQGKEKNMKNISFATSSVETQNRLCNSYFKGINRLKNILKIDDNKMIQKNEGIFKLLEPTTFSKYTESNINEFKAQVENLFKDFQFNKESNIKAASNLLFKGDILDIISEKPNYKNLDNFKKSKEHFDSESAKKDLLKDLVKIDPLLDKDIKSLETLKTYTHLLIKQFEKFLEKKDEQKSDNLDPELLLEQYTNIFWYGPNEVIKKTYMSYLINFYFYTNDCLNYLKELKRKYNDNDLIVSLEKNLEKIQLLEAFISSTDFEEKDYLKEEWSELKKVDVFLEKNQFLNEKIKEYVTENDENQFLKDFNNINKIKDAKINLSKSDPQKLIIKAYFLKNEFPVNIPEGLKLDKEKIKH